MRNAEKLKAEIALTAFISRTSTTGASAVDALAAVEVVLDDTGIDLDSPALSAADVTGLVDLAAEVLVARAALARSGTTLAAV